MEYIKLQNKIGIAVANWFVTVAVFSMVVTVLLTVADVISRTIINRSIEGTVEVCELMLVILAFFGLAWAEITGTHVKVDFLVNKLPLSIKRITILFSKIVTLSIISLLAYVSYLYAYENYLNNEVTWAGTYQLPVWPARYALFIGLVAFWIITIFSIISDLSKINKDFD